MADSATYSVGKHIQPGISALSPPNCPPPRQLHRHRHRVRSGAPRNPVLQNSRPCRVQRPGAELRRARASPPRPPRQHRPCSSRAAWAGCVRCWPCRRAAPPALPPAASATVAGGCVTLRSPALLVHTACSGRGARLPEPRHWADSPSGAPAARRGVAVTIPVGQRRRAICIKILTRSPRGCRRSNWPTGCRSPYRRIRGPAAHRECARHCLCSSFSSRCTFAARHLPPVQDLANLNDPTNGLPRHALP